jgi:hypothetical protein
MGYVSKMLTRFRPQYLDPSHRAARTPGRYIAPVYGSKSLQTNTRDKSSTLNASQSTELQAIIGTLLYYARAVDPSLLPIANELASKQAHFTLKVMHATNRALSYCAGHPNMCKHTMLATCVLTQNQYSIISYYTIITLS